MISTLPNTAYVEYDTNAACSSSVAVSVLMVGRDSQNVDVVRKTLSLGPYRLTCARDEEQARQVLGNKDIDLIIIDQSVPSTSAREFCRELKSNRFTTLLPVLMLGAKAGVEEELAALESGADEFAGPPLHPRLLSVRIALMARNKLMFDTLDEAESILFGLAQAVENRDKTTGSHCHRLASLGVSLGRKLGLPNADLVALHRGGYLHDIGKVAVPDAVLFKPAQLTADEWELMKRHTLVGENICRPMRSLAPVLCIIRSHHERWDGSGYPDGLRGEEIPLLARVIQTVDVYDALTSRRPYKPPYEKQKALRIMEDEARRGWRDTELVGLLHEVVEGRTPPPPISPSLANMSQHLSSAAD